jgi:hypothetical protein
MKRSEKRGGPRKVALSLGNCRLDRDRIYVARGDLKNLVKQT